MVFPSVLMHVCVAFAFFQPFSAFAIGVVPPVSLHGLVPFCFCSLSSFVLPL
jgi:hypothetical protein